MGQPVAVTVTRSHEPGRVRYELNRSLTGQQHENYESTPHRTETFGAVLAERLFATGIVRAVHVYSSVVTVDLVAGGDADALTAVIQDLYQYWKPGMVPAVPGMIPVVPVVPVVPVAVASTATDTAPTPS